MTFNTINIPTSAKHENETNMEAFERIMDTFKGEYEIETQEYTHAALGEWTMDCFDSFKDDPFPCAWIEDNDGNITEYFVFYTDNADKHLRHIVVE